MHHNALEAAEGQAGLSDHTELLQSPPLPPRERGGARAKRGKGEGADKAWSTDPWLYPHPPAPRAPSPGAGEGLNAKRTHPKRHSPTGIIALAVMMYCQTGSFP
ncbi:hypothetical protein GCM10022293_51500 [Azospirillum formosense]